MNRSLVGIVTAGWRLISRRGKTVLIVSACSNILLALLDTLALFVLAQSVMSRHNTLAETSLITTGMTTGAFVLSLFILRSILATLINWFSVTQLAREQTRIGANILSELIDVRNTRAVAHESFFFNAVERGPEFLVMTLNNAALLISESVTSIFIFVTLVYLDAFTALIAVAYFAIVVVLQHSLLARKASQIGENIAMQRDRVYQLLTDSAKLRAVLTPESAFSLRMSVDTSLGRLSQSKALSLAIAAVPRYLLEFTFALGLGILGLATYVLSGPEKAAASIVLFLGAGFRLMPTVNHVQGLALTMLAHVPIAQFSLSRSHSQPESTNSTVDESEILIKLSRVCFRYPESEGREALSSINLEIERGKQYAIVGQSGSGKTTLARILLGLDAPTDGLISRSSSIRSAFVSQDVHLAYASLAENIALVWNQRWVDRFRAAAALRTAGLENLIPNLDDTQALLNESVSGGEKQRIGLARAFYADANLVVLDEVSSALDVITESAIVSAIEQLKGKVTTILIAHRLTTVKMADQIFVLEKGVLVGSGTFAELSAGNPQFREMLKLAQI